METVCVNFKEFLFIVDVLADNKVNISATHSVDGDEYTVTGLQLKQIQSRCLAPALQEKQPQTLSAKLSFDESSALVLEVTVKYDFIPEMKEAIVIARKEVNGQQKLRNLLKQSQKNLYDLTEKLGSVKNARRIAVQKELRTYSGKDSKETLLSLQLGPGDYEVTFSFFVKPDNNQVDVQFLTNDVKTDAVPNGSIYLNKNAGALFYPVTLKTVVQLESQGTVSVATFGKQSSAQGLFQAKELVLIAEKITDLIINRN